ncbi:MAG: VCBS domain-containing protein, partial [Desulfovibrio sp.]|nr:VCBS domain-containing protein [Desulfovibrio sp.]
EDDAGKVYEHGAQIIKGDLKNNDKIPAGDQASVTAVDGSGGPNADGDIVVVGKYGTLTVRGDGAYEYAVDTDNAQVKALYASNAPGGESLKESFSYTLTGTGGSDTASLDIDIIPDKLLIGSSGSDHVDKLSGGVGDDVLVADPGGAGFTTSYPDYNMAVIMDTSDSMKDNGFVSAKLALAGLVEQYANYEGKVNLSIIGFANGISYNFADANLDAGDLQTWTDGKHPNSIATLKIGGDTVTVGVDKTGAILADDSAYKFRFNGDILEYQPHAGGAWTPAAGVTWTGGDMIANVLGMKAADGTNYEAGFNTAHAWFASQGANPEYAGYGNVAYFITDGEPTHFYRDYTTSGGVTLAAPPTFAGVYNRYDSGGESNKDFRYPEVYYNAKGEILTDASGAAYRINASGVFQSAGKNGHWSDLPGNNAVYAGTGWTAGDAEYGNSKDACDSLLKSLGGDLDLKVIGINISGVPLHFLNQLDNTGGAQSIASAAELQAALAAASPVADADVVGNDTVYAGDGGDALIFGDALNADFLLDTGNPWFTEPGHAPWTPGSDLAPGASLSIVRSYLAQTLHGGDETAVNKDEIGAFIKDNADRFGESDTVLGPDGLPRGGADLLRGGTGNDTIYGQGGNDTIDGGDGDNLLKGGGGDDRIRGGAGNDTIYGDSGNDTIDGGGGSDVIYTGGGDNVVNTAGWKNVVHVGSGDNIINSGGSGDVFVMDADAIGSGKTVINGFSGDDILDFRNLACADNLLADLHLVEDPAAGEGTTVFEGDYGNVSLKAYLSGEQLKLVLADGQNSQTIEINADADNAGFGISPDAGAGALGSLLHKIIVGPGEDSSLFDKGEAGAIFSGMNESALAAGDGDENASAGNSLPHKVISDFSGSDVLDDFKHVENLDTLLANLQKDDGQSDAKSAAFSSENGDVSLKAVFSDDKLTLTLHDANSEDSPQTVEIRSDPCYTGLDASQDFDTEAAIKFLQSVMQNGG